MKKFLILLAAMIFMMNSPVLADDEEIQQLEEEKAGYEEAAERARAAAELIQGKIDSVSELKRELDEDAAVATVNYEEKQAALDETLYRIDENEAKLAEVTAELNAKHGVLENRVRDIYIN
ncbi:MAG: peptidase M23, partial [Selenomonadaceae bacterium]|nr:peptidase M23 [Selenomonadaceae bacterium]